MNAGPSPSPPPSFLADCMLGRLARWLRILGFDASFQRAGVAPPDPFLLARALGEGRLLLTRDRELARAAARAGQLVVAERPLEQLAELLAALGVEASRARLLTRCVGCNQETLALEREAVRAEVPPYVYATAARFARCPSCRRVYWPATHASSIVAALAGAGITLAE